MAGKGGGRDRRTNVVVVVAVAIVLGTDVFHLVDTATLGAALNGAVTRGGQPDDVVGVDGVAGAAEVLLVAKGLDDNGVVDGSCVQQCAISSRDTYMAMASSSLGHRGAGTAHEQQACV